MPTTNLTYALFKGFIHNWLVAGPEISAVSRISQYPRETLEQSILKDYYTTEIGVTEIPVDCGLLRVGETDPNSLRWRYYRCEDDHFVDLTGFYPTCGYLQAWAYAQVKFPNARKINLVMTTNGPVDIWINGAHIHRSEHFSKQTPVSIPFSASINSGINEFLVRFENAAVRETPFVMALKLSGKLSKEIEVVIPTEIDSEDTDTRKRIEQLIDQVYLEKYVYGWFTGDRLNVNEPITFRSTAQAMPNEQTKVTYRLQSLNRDIFQEVSLNLQQAVDYDMVRYYPLRNGSHHLALVPPADLFFMKKIQLERRELFHVVRTQFSEGLYGIMKNRRHEALEEASIRRADSIYSEIAKMAIGNWAKLDRKIIQRTINRINQRYDGCITDLLGLIGVLYRFGRKPDLTQEIKQAIEDAVLSFRYSQDEPGEDIMDFTSENRQILFNTCEILAGQCYPEKMFSNSGQTGKMHREKGERLALSWLNTHAMYGWCDWDDSIGLAQTAAALSCLIDFAVSESISMQASAVMDKILYSLAINTFWGAFGSSHGRCDTASVLSSRLEATSGITRLMWGMGNFNEEIVGTVNLACMKSYDFPNILKSIAIRIPDAYWNRERQGCPSVERSEINKVTYRTNDYMLCSAQDFHPGEKGSAEHIWQATLGPDAIVYTNHPACFSLEDAHQPNFWRGNTLLPRTAQWGDVLIALYQLPEDDWLGFTHAYFPMKTFDEYQFEGKWAFARKGEGYLALFSSSGFEPIIQGPTAMRELRAYGKQTVWLCQMGHHLLDHSFEEFQQKVTDLDPVIDGVSIKVNTLRGDEIAFDASSPFMVNGQEQALTGFKHFEGSNCIAEYPAKQMDIMLDDQVMRLNLGE